MPEFASFISMPFAAVSASTVFAEIPQNKTKTCVLFEHGLLFLLAFALAWHLFDPGNETKKMIQVTDMSS